MDNYDDKTYGDRIAEIYDELYPDVDPAAIDLLEELAGEGPVLELGIGTGRIALSLQERGVEVAGVEVSEKMVDRLRDKPGGSDIEVAQDSFIDFNLDREFRLIYVSFNTFFALDTQEKQIQCFRTVKDHLAPEGLFVLEVFVPNLGRFTGGQTVRVTDMKEGEVQLEVSQVEPVAQLITAQNLFISSAGTRFYPVQLRYVWPSELDLMARLAGMERHHRWESWAKESFDGDSQKHISVYGRTG